MKFSIIFFSMFCVLSTAHAAAKKAPSFPSYVFKTADFAQADYKWYGGDDFKKMMKDAARQSSRKPATAGMSPQYKHLVATILGITSTEQLDGLLDKIDKEYDTYPDDMKFVVAQLVPLKVYRGWLYRLRPMVQKAKITDSVLVTFARQTAAAVTYLMPDAHVQTIWDYVAEPYKDDVGVFNGEADFQKYIAFNVYPAIAKASDRIKALNFQQQGVVWDNQIFYNTRAFPFGDDDRIRNIGETERLAVYSILQGNLYAIALLTSYKIDGMMAILRDTDRLVGFDAATGWIGRIDGLSAEQRNNIVKAQGAYLTLQCDPKTPKSGVAGLCTPTALTHLQQSVGAARAVFEAVQKMPDDVWRVMNPGFFRPFERQDRLALETIDKMVNSDGWVEVRSNVTGNMVQVNLHTFFTDPPHDLKSFLPDDFDHRNPYPSHQYGNGNQVEIRDFRAGRATHWNTNAYAPYSKGQNISESTRALNQAWGGWIAGAPLLLVN